MVALVEDQQVHAAELRDELVRQGIEQDLGGHEHDVEQGELPVNCFSLEGGGIVLSFLLF